MRPHHPRRSLAGLLPLVLALATLGSALPAGAEAPPRLVAVGGRGEVRVEPDQAKVALGVEAREPTLEAARLRANRTVEALLKLTRELGIPERQVASTRLSVMPEYVWEEKSAQRRLVAYQVSRTVNIDLRDLEKLGALVERGLSLGANQAGDPVLDHSRRTELEREALALATKDALRNATAMAAALGLTVGSARSLSATQDSSGPVPMAAPMTMRTLAVAADAGAPQTYQTGEIVFRASVNASFDLLVPAPAK